MRDKQQHGRRLRFARKLRSPFAVAWLIALAAVTVWHVYLASTDRFIGVADSAEIANIGRCIAQGKGYSTPTLWHFFEPVTDPVRPEDYYRPLQPVLAALSIRVFGDSVFAAKLPSIIEHLALIIGAFIIGTILFGRKIGLLGASFCLLCRDIDLYATLPRTDMGLVLWFFVSAYFISQVPAQESASMRNAVLAGLSCGFTYLQRQLGVLLLPVACIVYTGGFFACVLRSGATLAIRRWSLIIAAFLAAFVITVSPYLIRNYRQFGDPFHTIASNWPLVSVKVYYDMIENPNSRDSEHQYQTFGYYYGRNLTREIYEKHGASGIARKVAAELYKVLTEFKRGTVILFTFVLLALAAPLLVGQRGRLFCFTFIALLAAHALAVPLLMRSVQRYFIFILPFVSVLSAATMVTIYRNHIAAQLPFFRRYYCWLMAALAGVALVLPFVFFAVKATRKASVDHPYLHKAETIAEHTPDDARIMTLHPWEMAYHARRSTVMIPYAPMPEILDVARRCNVDFLCVGKGWGPFSDNVRPRWDEYRNSGAVTEAWQDASYILYRFGVNTQDSTAIMEEESHDM